MTDKSFQTDIQIKLHNLEPLRNIISSFSLLNIPENNNNDENKDILTINSIESMQTSLEDNFNIHCFEELLEYFVEDCFLSIDKFIKNNLLFYSDKSFDSVVERNILQPIDTNIQFLRENNIDVQKVYDIDLFSLKNKIKEKVITLYFDMHLGKYVARSLCSKYYKHNNYKTDYLKHRLLETKLNLNRLVERNLNIIAEKDKQQPEQRTQKWYEVRYNLLSASSIWKALGSQKQQNSLIYEKCMPLNTDKYKNVNLNSALHWGQKYEPIAQMYYEYTNQCTITEYGCIPHTEYDFLGASPDGIVTTSNTHTELLGRMLEIKCIVNREITGIPKPEYWIQTQMQMECCDLFECDFLECRFKEYASLDEFEKDIFISNDGEKIFNKNKSGNMRGIYMCFMKKNQQMPIYEYMPLHIKTQAEYDIWNDNMMDKYMNCDDINWITNYYWRLDEVSCVLIPRNKQWFNEALPKFEYLWQTILRERKEGYAHRAPTKRNAKTNTNKKTSNNNVSNRNSIPKMNIIKIDI